MTVTTIHCLNEMVVITCAMQSKESALNKCLNIMSELKVTRRVAMQAQVESISQTMP